jgi:hypothetical protein
VLSAKWSTPGRPRMSLEGNSGAQLCRETSCRYWGDVCFNIWKQRSHNMRRSTSRHMLIVFFTLEYCWFYKNHILFPSSPLRSCMTILSDPLVDCKGSHFLNYLFKNPWVLPAARIWRTLLRLALIIAMKYHFEASLLLLENLRKLSVF